MDAYGRSWMFMGGHGHLWTIVDAYGRSWAVMGSHGRSWTLMDGHGCSWTLMDTHFGKVVHRRSQTLVGRSRTFVKHFHATITTRSHDSHATITFNKKYCIKTW